MITLIGVSISIHMPVLFSSVCVCVCVCWRRGDGGATQTEATLISVLESNLASVQNGSLYQLGGSLPCLESGGSSSSSSSDAFLMTALKEQPDDHLLQRPTVCRGRTRRRLFMSYYCWSNSDPSHEWPVSIEIILKAPKVACSVLMMDGLLRKVGTRFLLLLYWSVN